MHRLVLAAAILLSTASLTQACQSLHQARRDHPGAYLSWRGHHCWFAKGRPEHHQPSRPSQRAKADTVSIPRSEGSSPSTAAPPAALPVSPMVDQVLTENSLIIHGVERLPLTARINDTTKQIDSVAVPWHSRTPSERLGRERMLRALGVTIFVSAVLLILVKAAGSMLIRLQRLT